MLEPTKAKVLQVYATRKAGATTPEPFLLKASGQHFYNTSRLDLRGLLGDADHIAQNLWEYLQGFSAPVRDIFEQFEFDKQVDRLAKANLPHLATARFAGIALHPDDIATRS